ncbi:hypothetical protein Tco_0617019 [Tanacetum coccineum]
MDVNWTSKDIKKVDVWDSLTKDLIRSFEMSFHNGGSVFFYEGSIFPFSNSILLMYIGRGKVLRNPFFITEVDKNANPEFSTIVLDFLFQEEYPGVPSVPINNDKGVLFMVNGPRSYKSK